MQVVYVIILSLIIITILIEGLCIFEQRQYFIKYRNVIKPICDFLCIMLLCALSIIGCIETFNLNIYFLIIYVAIYFFIKEIYSALITNKREQSIKIKLQTYVEKSITFDELFEYESSKKEKEKSNTWWIREYKTKEEQPAIGILLNGERHYFLLKLQEYSNSICYVINQINEYANEIKNVTDLKSIKIAVISDNDLAEEYGYNFLPHNKITKIKNPIVYKDTLFNMFMLSGYVSGNSLINIISSWKSMTLFQKIFNIFGGGIFALSFVCGIISISYIIFVSLKKTTK